jgi:hypothetical protein
MLPSLGNLRLVNDANETSAKTKADKLREREKARKEGKKLIKKRKAAADDGKGSSKDFTTVKEILTRRGFIEDEYPHLALNHLDSLEDIMKLEKEIRTSHDKSLWIFSSNPTAMAIRVDDKVDPELVETISRAGERFANKPKNDDDCGSFNCFEPNVPIGGYEPWAVALRTAIKTLNPLSPRFKMPETVSVRAPMLSNEDMYDENITVEERMELALTLFMTSVGISLPVLAALPIEVLNVTGTVVADGFMYVTESGWTDLEQMLTNLHNDVSAEEYDEAVRSIASKVVTLVERVAEHTIILSDIKLRNMVAKRHPVTKQFDVKMIDFSPLFTADLNMNYPGDGYKPTSKECAFFLNGILLINYVLKNAPAHKSVFKELAARVVESWRNMLQNGNASGFCGYLAKDSVFYLRKPYARNLVGLPDGAFEVELKETFYLVLKNYGRVDVVRPNEQVVPPNQYESYITRLVDRLAGEFN